MSRRWLLVTAVGAALAVAGCEVPADATPPMSTRPAVTSPSTAPATTSEPAARQPTDEPAAEDPMEIIALPSPRVDGPLSLEAALAARRSVRDLARDALTPEELGQLLWAAQGVTDADGLRRTAPSAGALYPLEVYAATADGLFRYLPGDVPGRHALERIQAGDVRPALRRAALDQAVVGDAPVVIVVIVVPDRTAAKYGAERAMRYVDLEAGHAAQNVLLQAVALGLASVPIGAFDDAGVAEVLGLPAGEEPRYLLPVGRPR